MFQPAGIVSPVRVVSMSEYVDICQKTPLTNQCCGMKRWRETKPATPDSQNPEDFSDLGRCMRPRFVGRLDFSPDKEECETTGPSTSMDLAEVQGLGFMSSRLKFFLRAYFCTNLCKSVDAFQILMKAQGVKRDIAICGLCLTKEARSTKMCTHCNRVICVGCVRHCEECRNDFCACCTTIK